MSYVRSIPVADAKGDHTVVYEFRDRRFLTKVKRFKLDTGELVELVEPDLFRVMATGEELLRLDK